MRNSSSCLQRYGDEKQEVGIFCGEKPEQTSFNRYLDGIKTRIGTRAQKISLPLLSKTFHKNKNKENQFGFDKAGDSDLGFA